MATMLDVSINETLSQELFDEYFFNLKLKNILSWHNRKISDENFRKK